LPPSTPADRAPSHEHHDFSPHKPLSAAPSVDSGLGSPATPGPNDRAVLTPRAEKSPATGPRLYRYPSSRPTNRSSSTVSQLTTIPGRAVCFAMKKP